MRDNSHTKQSEFKWLEIKCWWINESTLNSKFLATLTSVYISTVQFILSCFYKV
jgi:hypothetical protein